ncbi:MAG: hypothetical protein ABF436_12005, partial [Acetobacter okinawensis]
MPKIHRPQPHGTPTRTPCIFAPRTTTAAALALASVWHAPFATGVARAQTTHASALTAQPSVAPISDTIINPGSKVHALPTQSLRPLDAETMG